MTAIETTNMTNAAYRQLLALRKDSHRGSECVQKVVDSLMEEFSCSRRRAVLKVTAAWYDLEASNASKAYIDVSHTTGNAVVICDTATGRTSIFSISELLQLRERAAHVTHIQA